MPPSPTPQRRADGVAARAQRRPRRQPGLPLPTPPIARGEDEAAYLALRQALMADLAPRDTIETAFVQAAVDHAWKSQCYWLIEAQLLAAAPPKSDLSGEGAAGRTALVEAYQKHSQELEMVVRLRTRAEAQRDAALNDLERYRAAAAREAASGVIEAEFVEVR